MNGRLLAAALCVAVVHAHEIGTSRVSFNFDERGNYAIEVITDAVSLVEKLQPGPPPAPNPAQLQAQLNSATATFRRRVKLKFDELEVSPTITFATTPGNDPSTVFATIHLTGQRPQNARTVSWNYGWTFATYPLTIRTPGNAAGSVEWLDGGQWSKPFDLGGPALLGGRWETIKRYVVLGFTHILPRGLDHMLFVLGLYLLSGRAKSVLLQVSAFTVAHSITLGLSMYGILTLPSKVVEPLIAISIAYVAIENIFQSELKSWRVALVFAFGLLHGLGFAGALQELGLPRSEFLTALVSFNAGVEAGQLTVIAVAFLLVGWYCSKQPWYRARVVIPASLAIACTAVYWTVQRVFF